MYTPYYSNIFRKSYKKLRKSGQITRLEVESLIEIIATDYEKLPIKYNNHKLSGKMNDCWECHIKYDILLIYKIENTILTLVNIGTHSKLF
jgi:mRNA interferase YafQ